MYYKVRRHRDNWGNRMTTGSNDDSEMVSQFYWSFTNYLKLSEPHQLPHPDSGTVNNTARK